MIKGKYSNQYPLSKILIFIGMLLFGFGLSTVIGFLLAGPLFGIDLLNDPYSLSDYSNPQSIAALKFMQLLHSIGIFILPPLLFAYTTSPNWKQYLKLDGKPGLIYVLLTAVLMFISLPLINIMIELNEAMALPDFLNSVEEWMRDKEGEAKRITETFLQMDSAMSFVLNLIIIGLLPAIGEELIFRGMIQRQLIKRLGNYHAGIWIAAILFSAIHLQFYGFLPRMMLGVLFGYLFVWSGSLWIPMLAHFINNAGAVTIQYIFGQKFAEENIDSLGTKDNDWFYLITSVLLMTYFLFYTWKTRTNRG